MSTSSSPKRRPSSSSPREAWQSLLELAGLAGRPLERFLRIEAASGILLLIAATVALVWANSRWAESYVRVWHTPVGLRVGTFTLERTLEWFVNDVLMVVFFFVVGMEIRRELHDGELSDWLKTSTDNRRAPIAQTSPDCPGVLATCSRYRGDRNAAQVRDRFQATHPVGMAPPLAIERTTGNSGRSRRAWGRTPAARSAKKIGKNRAKLTKIKRISIINGSNRSAEEAGNIGSGAHHAGVHISDRALFDRFVSAGAR